MSKVSIAFTFVSSIRARGSCPQLSLAWCNQW